MQPLNMKLKGNVYEGSLNTIFLAKLNLVTSSLIYESLCKKWRVQHRPIVKCELWLSFWMWKVFHHPTYSPNLAPSDYYLVIGLKHDLSGRHFAMEEDLQSAIIKFFTKQDAEWYGAGIHKLMPQWTGWLCRKVGNFVRNPINFVSKLYLFFYQFEPCSLTFETSLVLRLFKMTSFIFRWCS